MNYDYVQSYQISERFNGNSSDGSINKGSTYEHQNNLCRYGQFLTPPSMSSSSNQEYIANSNTYYQYPYTYYEQGHGHDSRFNDSTVSNHSSAMYIANVKSYIPSSRNTSSVTANYSSYINVKAMKRKYANSPNENSTENSKQLNSDSDGSIIMFHGRDESYPSELNKLIHPTSCDLCNVKMNSILSAKDHFESKIHDRSITAWLKINYIDKGLEMPNIRRFLTQGSSGPDAYYCKACDLKLTSLTHANQHYAGRKHRLVITRNSQPSGIGYYNEEGQWIRISNKICTTSTYDNRFDIDISFKQQNKNLTPRPELYCSMCNVYCTSALQMVMHLSGSKHKRKISKNDGVDVVQKSELNTSDASLSSKDNVLNNYQEDLNSLEFIEAPSLSSGILLYRTPSGQYYCKVCNTTMTNKTSLQQHLEGKRHVRSETEANAKANLYRKIPSY